jgi:hypothetical protein
MTSGPSVDEHASMVHVARSIGAARLAFLAAAWLFVLSVMVQTALVGLDIFADVGGTIHRDFAYVYGWLAPILVLLAGVAHVPPRLRTISVVLLIDFALQTILPTLKDYPLLASLHTVNALLILGLAVLLARRATEWARDLVQLASAEA